MDGLCCYLFVFLMKNVLILTRAHGMRVLSGGVQKIESESGVFCFATSWDRMSARIKPWPSWTCVADAYFSLVPICPAGKAMNLSALR